MTQYVSERIKRLQREMNVLLLLKDSAKKNNHRNHKDKKSTSSDGSSLKRNKNSKKSSINEDNLSLPFPNDKDNVNSLTLTPSQTLYVTEHIQKNNEIEVFLNEDPPSARKQIIFECDRKHMEGDKIRPSNPKCRRMRSVSAAVKDDVIKRERENKKGDKTKAEGSKQQSKSTKKDEKKKKIENNKFIEETMSNTSKTIDMLQVQVQCSNANLQLLTAGRDFLAQTLQLLQVKYLGLRKEMNEKKSENEQLKVENQTLAERLTNLAKQQVVKYEELNSKIEQDKMQCEFMLQQLSTERERLLNVVDKQTKDITKLITENKTLHKKVNEETTLSLNYINNCENKITKLIHMHENTKNDALKMRSVIDCLQQKKVQENWKNLRNEIERLRNQNIDLKQTLKNLREKDEIKCKKIEQELMNFMEAIMRNEQIVSNERNNMLRMVEKLTDLIEMHKNRITQLLQINKQQEKLLVSQSVLLKKKEEELIIAEETNEKIKKRALNLEAQVEQLYQAMENLQMMQLSLLDNSCRQCVDTDGLKEDLQKTKSELAIEKEKLLIKEKVIEDQQDTIKSLKSSLSTTVTSYPQSEDTDELYHRLQKDKRMKKKLITEIEDLEWQKELLLQEISDLKSQDNSQEVQTKIKEQYRILSLLEDQVAIKQEEWQQEIENVNREKAQAIKVARFATQKLIETIQDFQHQSDSQKEMHSKVLQVIHHNKEFSPSTNTDNNIREICRYIQ